MPQRSGQTIGVDVPDPTEEFFEQLSRYEHDPRLARYDGAVRFDVDRDQPTEHWLIRFDQGNVRVTREVGPADLIIKANRVALNRIFSAGGARDIIAAYVRQAIWVEGNTRMLHALRIIGGALADRPLRSMESIPRSDHGT